MAITVTALDFDSLRQLMHRMSSGAVVWTKPQVNAAVQAVINRLELPSTQTAISNDIETAAPGVFDATQKRRIFVLATLIVAQKEGVL